jgi:pectin methylesterase-like acyl-CoA thioesterase
MKNRSIPIFCILFFFSATAAFAQMTWVVDQGGVGDFTTIQACIDAAADTDTCRVNPGTYLEIIDFSGKAIGVVSSSGPDDTTIDGQNDTGHVVTFATAETEDAVLEGFTVRGAGGVGSASSGIYCSGSSPTILDCIVTANTSLTGRSGINCVSASPKIENCTIRGNSGSGIYSSVSGGGIYLSSSSPEIKDSTISGNSLSCYKCSCYGGGIYSL